MNRFRVELHSGLEKTFIKSQKKWMPWLQDIHQFCQVPQALLNLLALPQAEMTFFSA
jgi:hypothetical protein